MSLAADMLAEIECRLNSYNGDLGDSRNDDWTDGASIDVTSNISFGRVLKLSSETPNAASKRAMQLCTTKSASKDYSVLYVSRKLSEYELACRLIAQASDLCAERMLLGQLSDVEWNRLEEALERICDQDFSVIYAETLESALVQKWLLHASSIAEVMPLLIIDDEILLSGFKGHSGGDIAKALFDLARDTARLDGLILVVEETLLH